jgi:hypothetical protein
MASNFKNLSFLGLFLIVSGVSYLTFDRLVPINSSSSLPNSPLGSNGILEKKNTKQTGVINFSGPKTQSCPLNGLKYTVDEEKIWSARRPLMVMIENHDESRPQSGLQNADIVYEAVSEGGITRFMGIFYCGIVEGSANTYDVGPVRSARTYFLDLASEYSDYPLYTHVGGANCSAPKDPVTGRQSGPCTTIKKAQAIEQISDYGWNNKGTWGDLSQFSLSYKVCRREPDRLEDTRATEHTMYCSTKELWNTAANRGLTNLTQVNNQLWDKNYKPWNFNQKDIAVENPTTPVVSFDFWPGYKQYSVMWSYDKNSNAYLRFNGSQSHIDFNTQKQISTKNVVVQYTKETRSLDEHGHNLYEVIGSGTGVLFQNGNKTDITWSKKNRASRTIFRDSTGKEVNFIPGQVWVEILPTSSIVKYEDTKQS